MQNLTFFRRVASSGGKILRVSGKIISYQIKSCGFGKNLAGFGENYEVAGKILRVSGKVLRFRGKSCRGFRGKVGSYGPPWYRVRLRDLAMAAPSYGGP